MKKILLAILLASLTSTAFAEQYWVRGVTKDDGWVDVNKARTGTYNEYGAGWFNNGPEGDGFLCWAASASDILTWWHNQNPGAAQLNPEAPHEQGEIWELFKKNYKNDSGTAAAGIEWYMNGVKTSQQPEPRDDAEPGGYYNGLDVDVEWVSQDIKDFDPAYKFLEDAGMTWWLPDDNDPVVDVHKAIADKMSLLIDQGYIISLGIGDENGTKHAVTLWGLATDDDGYLSKMWITDSDDWLNEYGPQAAPGEALIELTCTKAHEEVMMGVIKTGELDFYTIDSPKTTYQGDVVEKAGRQWYSSDRTSYFYDFAAFKFSTVAYQGVPEPATGTLSVLALAGLYARRRRK